MTPNDRVTDLLTQELIVKPSNGTGQSTPQLGYELEILFYGMTCFDPLPDGSGYRVLFPNGLDLAGLTDIPIHTAGVWVRDRAVSPTVKWSAFSFRNDFFVNRKQKLTITGLAKTNLNIDEFEGRVLNMQDIDSDFTIRENPDAVMDVIVDRGTLSAHEVNDRRMIVVKWAVQVEGSEPVRFTFGDDFVEIPSEVKQVYLVNVSPVEGDNPERHFQLFRNLSTDPNKTLNFKAPAQPTTPPTATLKLIDPTFEYPSEKISTPPSAPKGPATPKGNDRKAPKKGKDLVGTVSQQLVDAIPFSPDIVCSAVVSRPLGSAIRG